MFIRPYNMQMTDSGGSIEKPVEKTGKAKKKTAFEQTLPQRKTIAAQTPNTPAASVNTPAASVNTPAASVKTASSGASRSTAAVQTPSEPAASPKTPTLEQLFSEMLTRYMPETVSYTPMDEETIRSMLIGLLRPAYEQAIANRKQQTARYNAELDADAWARGMGTSTYVTDVKDRAFTREADDVNALESNYAASLASHLYDAMQSQAEEKRQIDQFNADQINRAREQAANAANALYQSYLNAENTVSSKSTASASGKTKKSAETTQKTADTAQKTAKTETADKQTENKTPAVTLEQSINLIARLSPQSRSDLYNGKGAYAQIHREITDSIGSAAFRKLMQEYPV